LISLSVAKGSGRVATVELPASGRVLARRPPPDQVVGDRCVDPQPLLRRDVLAHRANRTNFGEAACLVLPDTREFGKTQLAVAIGLRANAGGYPVQFDTADVWQSGFPATQTESHLESEVSELRPRTSLVIDDVGHTRSTPVQRNGAGSSRPTVTSEGRTPPPRRGRSATGDTASPRRSRRSRISNFVHHAEIRPLGEHSHPGGRCRDTTTAQTRDQWGWGQ